MMLYNILNLIISIHALRGEGDKRTGLRKSPPMEFQSTPSVGRATVNSSVDKTEYLISIHALRGEGDGTPFEAYFAPP